MSDLMGQTKTRLAQVVMAQAKALELLNRDVALATWEAELLAGQRQRILDFLNREEGTHPYCPEEELCYVCRLADVVYGILIQDPRDGVRRE